MSSRAEALLADLDENQRAAAEALVGPVCIIAGAGSGKTRTITHRIALGIERGQFAANRVLALTYTNRAAAELRVRLRELGAGAVTVRTFHSAALAQLQYFWPQLADQPAPKLVGSKHQLITETLEGEAGVDPQQFAAELEWRKYTLTDDEGYRNLERKTPLDPERFIELAERYEQLKRSRGLIDWEDALTICLGMIRSEPRVAEHIRSQYRFFTVDEYQDISPLQQALLETWLGERSELCVVGDPRQTIYSFTGASSSFLTDFSARYPSAEVIELNRNYRSSPQIVDFANRLLPADPLQAAGKPGLDVGVSVLSSPQQLTQLVIEDLAAGVPPSQIAVLTRVNAQLEPLLAELTAAGIKTQLRGTGRFFQKREVMQAISMLRALQSKTEPEPMFIEVSNVLASLGWTSQPQQTDSWAALNWFVELLDELGETTGLDEYLRELEERQRSLHEPVQEAVTLATVHAAKGLEWDVVYLPGVSEGNYPIFHAQTEAEVAEEQRLLYVAATRARRRLRVFAEQNRPQSRFLPR